MTLCPKPKLNTQSLPPILHPWNPTHDYNSRVLQHVTHKIKLIENMRKLYLRSEYTNIRASWYPEEILSKETFINLGCQINNWNIVILACFYSSMFFFFFNSVTAKYIFKALCLMSTLAILSVHVANQVWSSVCYIKELTLEYWA